MLIDRIDVTNRTGQQEHLNLKNAILVLKHLINLHSSMLYRSEHELNLWIFSICFLVFNSGIPVISRRLGLI